MLAACQKETNQGLSTPFIGGLSGFSVGFQADAPPKEVYDGGRFPFAVVVKIQNIGEFLVPKDKVKVSLSGIDPVEFGLNPNDLIKSPGDDMLPRRKDAGGNILESNPFFLEFKNLNHVRRITGSALDFPLRAEVCYNYGTIATSKLCSRKNVLNPTPGGICTINEEKKVANSGAPVQIVSLQESTRAQDKVAFTFKIQHVGTGFLYRKLTGCEKSSIRATEQKVFVNVREPASGVECVGLSSNSVPNQGEVTLFDGSNTVTCTMTLQRPGDFEFPVTIDLNYDYEDTTETNLLVKRSE